MEKQPKAFIFLDFLFSIIPVLLMIIFALNVSSQLLSNYENQVNDQILMDKLISISDYTIRYELAEKAVENNDEIYIPNKISEEELNKFNPEKLKEKLGLDSLYINFNYPDNQYKICIYRIVLYKEEIEKLYFCGE